VPAVINLGRAANLRRGGNQISTAITVGPGGSRKPRERGPAGLWRREGTIRTAREHVGRVGLGKSGGRKGRGTAR